MKSVRELLKEKPFCDRLIVAGKEEYNEYFDGESFTVVCDEKIVSSTLIRLYIENGETEKAAKLLGRPF